MRQSVIKIGINNFLNDIKFGKEYYSTYDDILNEKIILNEELFFFIILQTCLQTKFYGYFDELYVDVCKRKTEYVREILVNFRKATLEPPTYYNKFKKFCCLCNKMTEKEISINRKLSLCNFDVAIDDLFDIKNHNKRDKFISDCEKIYYQISTSNLEEKVDLKLRYKINNN